MLKPRSLAGYAARLAAAPNDIPALTGASFARWWFFDYPAAIHLLNDLLALSPIDAYGNLFRGSSRLLKGTARAEGMADLDLAIGFAPESPDVRFIVADAYTSARWLTRSGRSRQRRLPWQEVLIRHAFMPFLPAHILLGNQSAAAAEIRTHMELVTTELVQASVLSVGDTQTLSLVPGRSYKIPVPVTAGQTLSILTSSRDFHDTILVLLAPDGTPVLGSDDYRQ
jgi:hypothetical protein